MDQPFRRSSQSLSEWLVPARAQVVYTGVIDATDPENAGTLASLYADNEFRRIKLEVGPPKAWRPRAGALPGTPSSRTLSWACQMSTIFL